MGTMGDFHDVMKHIFAGKIKPIVDKSFPMREAAAAHERWKKASSSAR